MRSPHLVLVLTLLATAATAGAASPELPKRKAGLWEMKTAVMEMGGAGPQMQMCVGENSDALLAQPGGEAASHCTHQNVSREGNRVTVDAVCAAEGHTATVHGVFTGDFDTHYSGEIHTTYDPPLQGMASATMKQEGRWLGPCKAGQKPGDVSIQGIPGMGGGSFNVNEMMKNMRRPPTGR